MKCFVVLALITLTITNCLNLEKRFKRRDGTGSFESGYTLPGIEISHKHSDEDNQIEILQDAFIKPSGISSQSENAEKLGLSFKLTSSPGTEATKVMFKEGDYYYIPYRFFGSECILSTPLFSNMLINCALQNDEKENFDLKIVLPYGYYKQICTVQNARDIVDKINIEADSKKTQIRNSKKGINAAFGEYSSNNPLLKAANEGETKLAEQKKTDEAKKATLITEMADIKEKIKPYQTQIDTLKSKISDAEKKRDEYRTTASSFTKTNEEITKQLEKLDGTDQPDLTKKVADYKKLSDDALLVLNGKWDTLLTYAPGSDAIITEGKNAVTALDTTALNTALGKIVPTS